MKRRLLLALLPAPLLAAAAPPALQFIVEWRWVDSSLAPAAEAAVRDGAVVVGTAGSVSPRGALVTSSAPPAPPPVQRLIVLNGQRASVSLARREPLQWLDAVVELGSKPRIYAQSRQRERLTAQRLAITPSWPGGRAPVRVEFSVEQDDTTFQSTQLIPLERWQAVARSSGATPPAARGTISSTDAQSQAQRELQLRISLQP